jgi:hypothetical protein
MYRYPIRNSFLVSILAVVLGCSPKPYSHLESGKSYTSCLPMLQPRFSTVLYNAQVNVAGRHLSGLLLFKTMADSSIRVIFTNEMGVTFFDFEFGSKGFRVVSCVRQMNKKVVINRLKSDLGLLLQYGFNPQQPEIYLSGNELYHSYQVKKERIYYITDPGCSKISRIETASQKKKKIVINLSGYSAGMADSVYLAHQSWEYNITLKKIDR